MEKEEKNNNEKKRFLDFLLLSSHKEVVMLCINLHKHELEEISKEATLIYNISNDSFYSEKVVNYKSIGEFLLSFTSLDKKVTHIITYFNGWQNTKEILKLKNVLDNEAYLLFKISMEQWKKFIDIDASLIEKTLQELNFTYYDLIILNASNLLGIFKRKDTKEKERGVYENENETFGKTSKIY